MGHTPDTGCCPCFCAFFMRAAMFMRAQAHLAKQEFDDALRDCKQAAKMDPGRHMCAGWAACLVRCVHVGLGVLVGMVRLHKWLL